MTRRNHARDLGALFERVLLAAALAPAAGCCVLRTRVPAHSESSTVAAPASMAGRASGRLSRAECHAVCNEHTRSCYYNAAPIPAVGTLQCDYVIPAHCEDYGCWFGCGRVPEGLEPLEETASAPELARYFARIAQLESVSVTAFEALADELRAHGAPAALVRRAHAARRDESRHARAAAALTKRFGGTVRWPSVKRVGVRSLARIAEENASEGCVREAFGALLARHQSRSAGDARVRGVFAMLARDEARHASLAWAVDAWAQPRLSGAERERVRAANAHAADSLDSGSGNASEDVARVAGVPPPELARAMAREFRAALAV